MEHVINASTNVANRRGEFPLQFEQEILRGVVLGHVHLIFAERFLPEATGQKEMSD